MNARAFVLVMVAVACGTTEGPSTFANDAGQCNGKDAGATLADGGGVCCPAVDLNYCAGDQLLGGWAATADECCAKPLGRADEPHRLVVGSHGCPELVADDSICACLCIPDAGIGDSGADARDSD
jgi:hypothetical protein